MKRVFAFLLSFSFLLLPLLYAVPARAEETPWSTLFYTIDPVNEGEPGETGRLLRNGQELTLPRATAVSCDAARAKLFINGVEQEGGTGRLDIFGKYTVRVESLEGAGAVTYAIQELPDFGFGKYHVFTEFPVISCKNAEKIMVKRDDGYILDHTQPISQFGRFSVTAYGRNADMEPIEESYEFYIRYCSSVIGTDPATGKQALLITVGEFDGYEIRAEVDGTAIPVGQTAITAVGFHTMKAWVYSEKTGEEKVADTNLMPRKDDLKLQVRVRLDKTTANAPFTFDFSGWDANFYLDDQPVSGVIRVTEDGTHTLTVRKADGSVMEEAFLYAVGDEAELKNANSITFTFNNPHKIYAWIAVVPAALLLGAAVYLLIARRRIV